MSTTRFPSGINNATLPSVFEDMGQLDPTRFHNYFEDFNLFNASDFIITQNGSPTEAVGDEDGGILVVTTSTQFGESDFLQLANETFKFESGKKLFFKVRMKINPVFAAIFPIGLQIKDTTPLDATDGVFFNKNDATNDLDFHVVKDSVATIATAIHSLTDDTYLDLGFVYDGVDKVAYYINNQRLGFLSTTNLPDDEELTPSFGAENGDSNPKTLSIDYIFVAKER